MGGIHASLVPDEAARYADALFIGECEAAWPQVDRRLRSRRAQAALRRRHHRQPRLLQPDRRIFEKYQLRVRVGADHARLPDGLLVLLGHGLQRPAVPDARRRRRRRRNGRNRRARHHLRRRRSERLLAQGEAALPRSLSRDGRPPASASSGSRRSRSTSATTTNCRVWRGRRAAPACSSASRAPTRSRWRSSARTACRSAAASTTTARTSRASARHGIGVVGSFILGIDSQDMSTIVDDILRFAARSRARRLEPDDPDAAAGHARLRALRRRRTDPVQELSGGLGEVHARVPGDAACRNVSGAGLMRRYVQVLQFFRPEHVAARYWRTHDTVSPEAAWHAFLWNRVWTNYCLRGGVFRQSPLADSYPASLPRVAPARPAVPASPHSSSTPRPPGCNRRDRSRDGRRDTPTASARRSSTSPTADRGRA